MKKSKVLFLITGLCCMGLSSCGSNNGKTDNSVSSNEPTEDTTVVEVIEGVESSSSSSDESYTVSSGYSTDPNYRPTVSDDGDYHTIDGKRRQIQYQGSQEQQRDLDMIDEYMRTHPED